MVVGEAIKVVCTSTVLEAALMPGQSSSMVLQVTRQPPAAGVIPCTTHHSSTRHHSSCVLQMRKDLGRDSIHKIAMMSFTHRFDTNARRTAQSRSQ